MQHIKFQGFITSKNFLEILLSGACEDILSNMKYKLLNLVPHTMINEAQCSVKLFGHGNLYVPHLSVKLPILIGEQSEKEKESSGAIPGCIACCSVTWAL